MSLNNQTSEYCRGTPWANLGRKPGGTGNNDGCVDIAPGEPLKLGVLQALSGGVAPIGQDQTRGIELALASHADQFLGQPIELLTEDERCSSEGGTIGAMKVVADRQVVAIVGTTCSGAATTASKVMSEAGLSMVSGANTAPSLTAIGGERGAGWQPGYLRAVANEALMARAAAAFAIEELGVTRAATIDDGDTYSRGYAEAFGQSFSDLGGEMVLEISVDKGDTDMHPVLQAIVLSSAEVVFFPVFQPEADHIILQAGEVPGLEDTILMGGGALLTDALVESVGAAGVGLLVAGRAPLESPALKNLALDYESRYGEPPRTLGYGSAFDATNLLLAALEAAAVLERDGTLDIGLQALRDALYATDGIEGVSGTFDCDDFGDCISPTFHVMRLDDPAAGLDGLLSNVIYSRTPER